MFKGLIHKIDNALMKTFDPPEQHCDGCGETYPSYFLNHISDWTGDFCNKCIKYNQPPEEGYTAWCGMCNEETHHIGFHCQECY